MVDIRFKRLNKSAKVPSYAHEGDAGMDIYSCEEAIIAPKERKIIKTGISAAFPEGHVALIWDRSGNAAKRGIKTMAGVIDSGYRGEWGIVLLNTSDEEFKINIGDRIAQALVQPVIHANITEVEDLEDSSRGEGGFGSTGE
jgi:dUTP pyrophosphatase